MSEKELRHVVAQCDAATTGPLAFQQQFYLDIHLPGNTWNISDVIALLISGELSIEILQRCFQELVQRHELLRTRIVSVDGVHKQHIDEYRVYHLQNVNFADVRESDVEKKARATRFIEELLNTRCDLGVGPLFGVRLVKLAERENVLILSMHHVIYDVCSLELMFRELWLLYSEFIQGRPSPLHPLQARYADYVVWQEQMERAWVDKHGSYWNWRLASATGVRWPIVGRVDGIKRGTVEIKELEFGKAVSAGLCDFARRARSLLSMVMLTMYVAVLARWCGQTDFIVATTISGRDRAEHELVFGYFAHIVYLRMQLMGNETFIDLVGGVTQEFYRTLLHKDFGRLAAQVPELLAGTLFQWIPGQPDGPFMPPVATKLDLKVEPFPFKPAIYFPDIYNIAIWFGDSRNGICGGVGYRTDVFTADLIDRFVSDLRLTVEQAVRNPYACVAAAQTSVSSAI